MSGIFDREPDKYEPETFHRRDAETYIAIGIFIAAIGVPVMVGTIWALDRPHAALINFICGLVLTLLGAASIAYGWLWHRRNKKQA
ncbi:MAG TPA: hypothetical protein PKI11_17080 [Candidatus Hydrogenedentes bacterium]|nr:hypothetical protein [Candidatus Hydrogenedentota bacterium]HNT86993.1 hypothetical protein [Candidatus Hydrogenedentota bacterium]